MNKRSLLIGIFAAGMAAPALADDLGVTLQILDEHGGEERVMREIALPEGAAAQAHESARHGLQTANRAREGGGRELGRERAMEARERGQAMRGSARESRQEGQAQRETMQNHRPANPGRPNR